MTERIEIVAGDAGWRQAEPLLQAVWPPEVVATLPGKHVVWARADWQLLVFNPAEEIIGHVGIVLRDATWDGRPVRMGGIGGVSVRQDYRHQGIASTAMRRAAQEMRDTHGVDFALLFCEPRLAPVYVRLGWRKFDGDVFVMQPQGRIRFDVTVAHVLDFALAPSTGVLDLCGLPW